MLSLLVATIAAASRTGGSSTAWIIAVGLASLLGMSAVAVAIARRKRASHV